MAVNSACGLMCAGVAAAVANPGDPQRADSRVLTGETVAHLYINVNTGERVATLTRDAGRGSYTQELWVADNALPCAAFGQNEARVAIFDDIDGPGGPITRTLYLDWGDIRPDSVVDAVQVEWATQHQDTDADLDGVGDGVPGFGAVWSWYDGDNGFNSCTRAGLVALVLYDLPGVIGSVDPDRFVTYTATVDLASSFSSALTFEIGDTDHDPQGASHHNPGHYIIDLDSDTVPDGDLDGDWLADFSYAQQYIQPGTVDFDGDTLVDGDPLAAAAAGVTLVAPSGPTVFDGTNYSIHPVDPAPAGQGIEEGFDVYADLNSDGFWEPEGTFWYGGFTCDANGNGIPGDTRPFSQFRHVLYVLRPPTNECGDLYPPNGGDGQNNFFDIAQYLLYYKEQHPIADMFPWTGDGEFNFFDLAAYLAIFSAGCP